MSKREENIALLKGVEWDKYSDRTLRRIVSAVKTGHLKTDEYDPSREDEVCICGHTYYRHYDGYEGHSDPVGCKYCGCDHFRKPEPGMRVVLSVRYDPGAEFEVGLVAADLFTDWPFGVFEDDELKTDLVQLSVERSEHLVAYKGDDEIVLTARVMTYAEKQGWIVVDIDELSSLIKAAAIEMKAQAADNFDYDL